MLISFLTDFGDEDGWVAACKGQILSIAPETRFINISHHIPRFDIRKGALVLASTLPYLPVGIHIVIIDPGVGSSRKSVIVRVGRGDIMIGPDNGVLALAAERMDGVDRAIEITNAEFLPETICPTFHGRDIFSPVAAHISLGREMESFGPELGSGRLAKKPWNDPCVVSGRIMGEIIDIDKFGTLRSNIPSNLLQTEPTLKSPVKTTWGQKNWAVPLVRTFSDVLRGRELLLIDSSGFLSLAVNCGNAAKKLGCHVGDSVVIYREC
jgi:S-adenosylmethionine hydrolase